MTRWARAISKESKASDATCWSKLNTSSANNAQESNVEAEERVQPEHKSPLLKTRKLDQNSKKKKKTNVKKGVDLKKKSNKPTSKLAQDSKKKPQKKKLKKGITSDKTPQPAETSSEPVGKVSHKAGHDAKPSISLLQQQQLVNLKAELKKQKVPRKECWKKLRNEKHKMVRSMKRTNKTCFRCRKAGHVIANCPTPGESGTCGICFKCGSTEHIAKECKQQAKTTDNNYPYAVCFICQQEGHLSAHCPDNTGGIYPQGGSCYLCGSTSHKKMDCPKLSQEINDSSGPVVQRAHRFSNMEMEVEENTTRREEKDRKFKTVVFK